MPKSITFEIPGRPLAKQRAKKAASGHFYTPKQTVNYEDFIKYIYLELKNRLWFDKYVWIGFQAYFKIPKSTSKKRAQLMLDNKIEHDKTPDIDNCLKVIMDGLKGAAYAEDAKVTKILETGKYYTEGREKVVVTLTSKNEGVREVG